MKTILGIATALTLGTTAWAVSFQNLDFENVSEPPPGGWRTGDEVSVASWEGLYYDLGNDGLFRVNAMNAGAVSWPTITAPSAIAGQYSMGFLLFAGTPQVGVAQTATLGPGEQWLTLVTDLNRTDFSATGTQHLQILFNDNPVSFDLSATEINGRELWLLKGDLRSYAGQTGTLKILAWSNSAEDFAWSRLNVDNLQLVPEPPAVMVAASMGIGSLLLKALVLRRPRNS